MQNWCLSWVSDPFFILQGRGWKSDARRRMSSDWLSYSLIIYPIFNPKMTHSLCKWSIEWYFTLHSEDEGPFVTDLLASFFRYSTIYMTWKTNAFEWLHYLFVGTLQNRYVPFSWMKIIIQSCEEKELSGCKVVNEIFTCLKSGSLKIMSRALNFVLRQKSKKTQV